MSDKIKVKGATAGLLNNVDLELPRGRLICFGGTGRSGGQTMALDILYAESRRAYLASLSAFERTQVGSTVGSAVEEIIGLPPAVLYDPWERRGGTIAHLLGMDEAVSQWLLTEGVVHCLQCGGECHTYAPTQAALDIQSAFADENILVLGPITWKGTTAVENLLEELQRAGFLRLSLAGQIYRIEEVTGAKLAAANGDIDVVIDRLKVRQDQGSRISEAVRQGQALGRGRCKIQNYGTAISRWYNRRLTCVDCGTEHEAFNNDDFRLGQGVLTTFVAQVHIAGIAFSELSDFTIGQWIECIRDVNQAAARFQLISPALEALEAMGLAYLKPAESLKEISTGEYIRLCMASGLGRGLVGMLYIYSGVSTGSSNAQVEALVPHIRQVVSQGNTVLLLDHHPVLQAAADVFIEFKAGIPYKAGQEEIFSAIVFSKPLKTKPHSGSLACLVKGHEHLADMQVEIPLQALVGIRGGIGAGKTVFVESLAKTLTATKKEQSKTQMIVEPSGLIRQVKIIPAKAKAKNSALLEELGLGRACAQLLARSPAALKGQMPLEWFSVAHPGGRCPGCEGRGELACDMEFMESIKIVCPDCTGQRFRSEILEIRYRGLNLSDIYALNVKSARREFAREPKLSSRLEAALVGGLGDLCLGDLVEGLTRGERIRLELARIEDARPERVMIILDSPTAVEHITEVQLLGEMLRRLVDKGFNIVVADPHAKLSEGFDWLIELGPGSGPQGGKLIKMGQV